MIADFFSVHKMIFLTIRKTTNIKFLISRKIEVTIVPLNRWKWTKYHRFRALNIPKHEHSTSKINTIKSALACSLFCFVFVWFCLFDFYRFVLSLPSLLSQSLYESIPALWVPDLQQAGISGLHVRYQVLSVLPPCLAVRWNLHRTRALS